MKQCNPPNQRSTITKHDDNPIGRFVVIAYGGKCYVGNVLDCVAGTNDPKRVRIQYDAHLQGKVVMPGEYVFKHFADEDDDI